MDKSTDINDLPFKKQNNMPGGGPNGPNGGPMGAMGQAPPNPINTSQDGVSPAARFALSGFIFPNIYSLLFLPKTAFI